jgi:hypothetical protein
VWVDVWVCVISSAVHSHSSLGPPSLRSSSHSLRSFVNSLRNSNLAASPVKSYGVNARVVFSCIRRYCAAKQRGSELRSCEVAEQPSDGATEDRANK